MPPRPVPPFPRPRSASPPRLPPALLVLALGLLPGGGAAQVTEGPLAPGGRLGIEVSSSFFHASRRFGLREVDGATVEEVEPLGFDLRADEAARLFPGTATLEARLRTLLDDPGYRARLGRSVAEVAQDVSRIPVRVELGVVDWLTVGVTVPFVRTRTEATFALDAGPGEADLGLSPAVTSLSTLAGFLESLTGSAASARARASSLCEASDPGCAAASALADDAEAFADGLRAAYAAGPLFPASGTGAGDGLRDRLSALNTRFADAGVAAVASPVPLADSVLTTGGLSGAFGAPLAGFGAASPTRVVGLWELGDVEVTAAVRLLEGEVRDSAGARARARWTLGARGLVRLGTGTPDDPDVYLDVGTGDGQTDLEGGLFANVRVGRWGLWADTRYGVQRPVSLVRRAVAPDVVLAPAATRVGVRWTPGSYLQAELSPRLHLTTELAVAASWRFHHKGSDTYEVPGAGQDDATRPDASLLELETARTLHELGGGLVFSTLEAWREGRTGVPFEARFGVQAGVAGSGGQTPRGVRLQVGMRLFRRLWGG